MYSLNLNTDGRILSVTYAKYCPNGVIVNSLPDGNIADYKYINGGYVYQPLPVIEQVQEPTQVEKVEAQATYTAMMTDTLIGGV